MHNKSRIRTSLLAAIQAYCLEHGMSDSAFGVMAARDPHFVFRLRDGKGTLAKLEEVEDFLVEVRPFK